MKHEHSEITRRGFLSTAVSCAASAGLLGIAPGRALAQDAVEEKAKQESEVIYRQLGRTGFRLPIISQGVGFTNNPAMVQASYEAGVRHFDTAANYQFGRNEQMVGRVIKKLGVRDKVNIGTKIHTPAQRRGLSPQQSKKKLFDDFDGSLKRLATDYVDILYIHDVGDPQDVSDPAIIEALEQLKEQKKALAVGISTHTRMADVINAMTAAGVYDVVLTSFNFTMADDTDLLKAIADASSAGIGVIGMKVMAGGARWPNPTSRRDYSAETIARACLKWVLRNDNITTVIPGYDNYEHLNQNFSIAGGLELTKEEESFLSDNSIKLGMGFCRQCRKCLASCPNDADIPTLMRTHMYAAQYGNFQLARATLDSIPRRSGIKACQTCTECAAGCANSVDIDRRIGELKLMYA